MTVNSEDTPRVQYTANSITTIFPITFVYDDISDVHVYFISNSTGLATAWTKDASGPTGYTVSAGAIVANTAPSNGYLVAVCTTPVTQLVDVKPNRALTADTLEGVFDKLTLIGRDLKGSVSRALIYGPTYTGSIPYAEDLADEIKQDSVDASVAAVNALTFATSLHIDNIAALRLFPGGETTSIYLDCHTTNGDGGHGRFRWDATSTAADDNGVTIAVTGVAQGRWVRQFDGPYINVRWWGIHANLIDDDSVAIQAALDYIDSTADSIIHLPILKGDAGIRLDNTINITKRYFTLMSDNLSGDRSTSPKGKWNWYGAADEPMITITDPLRITIKGISLHGRDIAGYGILFDTDGLGWGVSNFEFINIRSNTKNAVRWTGSAGMDTGRNRFYRCSFWTHHAITGVADEDAVMCYDSNSNVIDVYDSCEFFYFDTATGVRIPGAYGIYFKSGGPRAYFSYSYTKADTGIYSGGTAAPTLRADNHYSEDFNFFVMDTSIARAQRLSNCDHVVPGGISIQGKVTTGGAFILDGGSYDGTVDIVNTNSAVTVSNAPSFDGTAPTFSEPYRVIWSGRSPGSASIASGTLKAASFIPATRSAQTGTTISTNVVLGELFLVGPLTGNTTISAPSNVDAVLDVGRIIEYKITGHATNLYTVTFNAIFKKAGGAYTHSGAGKTDIIRFRYDGTTWNEISRSMDIQ